MRLSLPRSFVLAFAGLTGCVPSAAILRSYSVAGGAVCRDGSDPEVSDYRSDEVSWRWVASCDGRRWACVSLSRSEQRCTPID